MNPHPQLDLVSVVIALISGVLAPQLAAVIGPYVVIVLAASTGAAWALSRREPGSRLGALAFFMLLVASAVMLTAAVAMGLSRWLGWQDTSWLFAPIAVIIGAIGDDWPRIGRWAIDRARGWFERSSTGGGNGQP